MNKIVVCKTIVKTVLLWSLVLCVACLPGCPKKQPAGPPSQAKPQDLNQPQPNVSPAKPAVKTDSNMPPGSAVSADTNQAKKAKRALNAEKFRQLLEHKKGLLPAESNELGQTGQTPELTLQKFDSLTDSDEKIDFISEFADAHPESLAALADKALNDKDVDVRNSAMEALSNNESNGPEVVDVVSKALKDTEEQVRQTAVQACVSVNDPRVGKILAQALDDSSEDVRTAALQVADQKDAPVRLEVLKTGIKSSYEDIKSGAVSSLTDMSSPDSVDVLIAGLKDSNPEFREEVKSALNFLVSQEFDSYDQAKSWWDKNRAKFDDDLSEKEEK